MKLKRQHIAVVLLLSLAVGGVLAPFSHYVYMLVADAYAHEAAHHMSHDPGHVGHEVDGSYADDGHKTHLVCDYAELFATYSATHPPSTQANHALRAVETYDTFIDVAVFTAERHTFYLRDPPLV